MATKKQAKQASPETDRTAIRMLVRLRDDYQGMRKRIDNRLGRKADGTDQDIDERQFVAEDMDRFVALADNARDQEGAIERMLLRVLRRFPVYREYLAACPGVGPIAAGWIVGEIDIHIATTPSKLWQFCGLNPGMVRGKKRKQIDTRNYEIITTNKMIPGDRLTPGFVSPFHRRLRTALVGVMGDGFLKAGIRGEDVSDAEYDALPDTRRRLHATTKHPQLVYAITPAAATYLAYKTRLANSEQVTAEIKKGGDVEAMAWKDTKAGHRHRAAIRYMVKQWLAELYNHWREIEGLEVRPPYHEEKLGHKHGHVS